MKEIVINRMFSGRYLRDNIGHEVINLFQADNGKHYLYLNDAGIIGREHFDNEGNCLVDTMLLAHTIEGTNAVEIIGLATGLHPVYNPTIKETKEENNQERYAKKNVITYGGVSINSIFDGSEKQTVNITFEAKDVKKVADGKRVYLKMADKQEQKYKELETYEGDKLIHLSETKLGQSLKLYVIEGTPDYEELLTIVEDASLWGDSMPQINGDIPPTELSYLDVCQCSYDELAYSNAMAYFAKKYPKITFAFLDQLTGIKDPHHSDFTVHREDHHIDLLFFNNEHLVVVENKIKSELNGIEKDSEGHITRTQLDDYYESVETIKEQNHINRVKPYFFIFAPNYSPLQYSELAHADSASKHTKIGEYFVLVLYKELYDFLKPYLNSPPYSDDALFLQFVQSLERHTHRYDDGFYYTTIRRFFERIKCSTELQNSL